MTANLSLNELLRSIKSDDPLVNTLLARVDYLIENVEFLLETTPVTDDNDTWVGEVKKIVSGTEHELAHRHTLERDFLFSLETKNPYSNYYRNPAGGNV